MIDVLIEEDGWNGILRHDIVDACERALRAELGIEQLGGTVTALFTHDEAVKDLNRDFRGKDSPTNVLSFPAEPVPGLPDEMQPLGDLALALETCRREAADRGIDPKDHVAHLIVHGLLHLLGYDHISDDDADEMEDVERRILSRLGIGDPYAEPPGH